MKNSSILSNLFLSMMCSVLLTSLIIVIVLLISVSLSDASTSLVAIQKDLAETVGAILGFLFLGCILGVIIGVPAVLLVGFPLAKIMLMLRLKSYFFWGAIPLVVMLIVCALLKVYSDYFFQMLTVFLGFYVFVPAIVVASLFFRYLAADEIKAISALR